MSKIIKLIVEKVPDGYERPYISRVEPSKLKVLVSDMDSLDTVTMKDINIIIDYPIEVFGYNGKSGKAREVFYIREKDKKTFKQLIDGFIAISNEDMIDEFIRYLLGKHLFARSASAGIIQDLKDDFKFYLKSNHLDNGKGGSV
jgi:hypothetical protein